MIKVLHTLEGTRYSSATLGPTGGGRGGGCGGGGRSVIGGPGIMPGKPPDGPIAMPNPMPGWRGDPKRLKFFHLFIGIGIAIGIAKEFP